MLAHAFGSQHLNRHPNWLNLIRLFLVKYLVKNYA